MLLNDNEGVFFARQLEHVKARTYDVQYADLKYRGLFPVSMDTPAGATSITYQTFDHVGVAKIIANYAADLPRSDASGRETTVPVRTIGTSFGYSVKEVKSAAMAGTPLDQRRANSARRSIEEKMNAIAYYGDSNSGLIGFMTQANIPQISIASLIAGGATIDLATPAEWLAIINFMFSSVHQTTLMKEMPNTLLLPVKWWNYITQTPRSADSDMTIASYLVANSPYLSSLADMIPVNELSANSPGNPFSENRMYIYTRSEDKLQFEIPEDITFYNQQERNLEMIVPVSAECGGVNWYYPLSAAFAELPES